MIEKVARDMIKDVLKDATEGIVNSYLNKRYREKHDDERDPLRMVTTSIYNDVVKSMLGEIAKRSVEDLALEYLIESQFIMLFNHNWLKK